MFAIMFSNAKFDLLVAGAGPAGFAAACAAARSGAEVLLIDQNSGPGGVGVFCGCPSLCGVEAENLRRHGAVDADFMNGLIASGAKFTGCTLCGDEEMFRRVMTGMLKADKVKMLFYTTLIGCECRGNRIQSAELFCMGTRFRVEAGNFIDCTGDAVLAKAAGAGFHPVSPEESMTKTVLFKLEDVDPFDKAAISATLKRKQFPLPQQNRFMGFFLANGSHVVMNLTAACGDAGVPGELTRMDMELREQVPVIIEWLRRELPEFSRCRLVSTAMRIGVRCSRNIIARENITCEDIEKNTPVAEPVAFGFRKFGDHFVDSFDSPWTKRLPGFRALPYGALRPPEVDNLAVAGRCIGVEPRASTSIRYMPVCMATGEAAGLAAAAGFPAYPLLKPRLSISTEERSS